MRDYRFFRSEGRNLFCTQDPLARFIEDWEGDESGAQRFEDPVNNTTSGISKQRKDKANRDKATRLVMALSGGIAMIVPMFIMTINPGMGKSLITTSCFVVVVAIGLAIFMDDSQPKDVVACTAAYAAVLVVFVGAGGGT